MKPAWTIAASTSALRAFAPARFVTGSYTVGRCGSPARSAARPSASVQRSLTPKYAFAAVFTPYERFP